MLRRWYGRNRCGTQDGRYGTITDPSQGLSLSLGAVYIDVSFPWPSSSPWLDILVHRQSDRTGLPSLVPCSCLDWLSLQHYIKSKQSFLPEKELKYIYRTKDRTRTRTSKDRTPRTRTRLQNWIKNGIRTDPVQNQYGTSTDQDP